MASIAGLKRRLNLARVESLYALRGRMLGRTVGEPVVIVGCGHSGTTLLLSILDAHSHIFAVPYEAKLGKGDVATLRGKVEWFDKLTLAEGKSRWVEKTPANVYHLDRLFAEIPGLKVLVMVRDGRDVACSMKVRFEASLGGDAAFEKGVTRWKDENLAWLRYESHPAVLMVKYEELVKSFEPTIRAVLRFLGEDFEPRVLEFHHSTKNYLHRSKVEAAPEPTQENIAALRNWQVHQPLFDGSGRWRSEMNDAEKRLFKDGAGDLLMRFGYAGDLAW